MRAALAAERTCERLPAVCGLVGEYARLGAARVPNHGGREHEVGGESRAGVFLAADAVADCDLCINNIPVSLLTPYGLKWLVGGAGTLGFGSDAGRSISYVILPQRHEPFRVLVDMVVYLFDFNN